MSGKNGLSMLESWVSKMVDLKKQAMEMDTRTATEDDGTESYAEGARAKENKQDVTSQSTADPVDSATKPNTGSAATGAKKPENAPDSGTCDENTESQGSGIAEEQTDGAIPEPPAEDSMEKDSAANLVTRGEQLLEALTKTAAPVVQAAAAAAEAVTETSEELSELQKQAAVSEVIDRFAASGVRTADMVLDYLGGFAKSAQGDIDPALMAEMAGGAPEEELPPEAAMAPEAAADPVADLAGAAPEEIPSEEELAALAEELAAAGITPEELLAAIEGTDIGGLEPTAAAKARRIALLDHVVKRASDARSKLEKSK